MPQGAAPLKRPLQRSRVGDVEMEHMNAERCSTCTTPKRRRPAAKRWLGALTVVLLAAGGLLAGADSARAQGGPPSSGVANPAPDRAWGGCQLDLNTTNAITNAIKIAISNWGSRQVDLVVVHSFNRNNGQPLTGGNPNNRSFTGPVYCAAPGVSLTSTSESVNLTNVELTAVGTGTAILYQRGINLAKRFCNSFADMEECEEVVVDSGGPCTIPYATRDNILSAIRRGRGIANDVSLVALLVYSIDGGLPAVCDATGFKVESAGQAITGPSVQIRSVDHSSALYIVRGTAKESRVCQGTETNSDCFEVTK